MSKDLLTGRIALITGAGSGIGEATARRFAAEGAAGIAIVDRDEPNGQRVADDLAAAGTATIFVAADVSLSRDCDAAVAHTVGRFGRLDVAVNNAGIVGPEADLVDYDDDAWRSVQSINLDGVFYCLRAEVRQMSTSGGGAIVNTASMFSLIARRDFIAYVAAKHGVLGITRAAALEYASRGIRVNCVAPGVVQTPLLEANVDAAGMDYLRGLHPMDRMAFPDEIAAVISWLASDQSGFVTGAVYPIDGAATVQ